MTTPADLPADRSGKPRTATWHPAPAGCPHDGTVTATDRRGSHRYLVEEFYPSAGWEPGGRAFRLVKAGGVEARTVMLADKRDESTCTCEGFSYAAKEKADLRTGVRSESLGCIHLDALHALVAAGHLPESRTNGERDTGDVADSDIIALLDRLAAIPDPADRRTAFHDAELQVIDRHWADRAAVRRGGVECPF